MIFSVRTKYTRNVSLGRQWFDKQPVESVTQKWSDINDRISCNSKQFCKRNFVVTEVSLNKKQNCSTKP